MRPLPSDAFGWRHAAGVALTYALVFVGVDALLPTWLISDDPWELLQTALGTGCAALLAGGYVTLAVPRLTLPGLLATQPLVAAIATAVNLLIVRQLLPVLSPQFDTAAAQRLLVDQVAYQYWSALLYGSLLSVVVALAWRAERSRFLLVRAEIERRRSDAMLAAERLALCEARLDPVFLLHGVEAAARRYAEDRAQADAMLDALILRLRAAMSMPRTPEGEEPWTVPLGSPRSPRAAA